MRETLVTKNVRILIVDDNEIQNRFLRHLLKSTSAVIDTAGNVDDLKEKVSKHTYDLMFIDYHIPSGNAFSLFRELNEQLSGRKKIPAILLDSDITEGFGREIFKNGFTNFLEKPVEKELLEAVLFLYLPPDKVFLKKEKALDEADYESDDEPIIPDFIKNAKGLNVEEGLKNCGSVDSFLSAIKLFQSSIKKKSDEIEGYYKKGDIKNYTILVHALKSSARTIGIDELSEKAKLLEKAGNDNDKNTIDCDTMGLLRLYREYIDILGEANKEEKKEDLPKVPDDVLIDAVNALKEFVSAMDVDLTEMVLNTLDGYSLSDEDEKLVKKLHEKLIELDWDGMKEILDLKQG